MKNQIISIEMYRIQGLLDTLTDWVEEGTITKNQAINLACNLIDEDKQTSDTELEIIVDKFINEI